MFEERGPTYAFRVEVGVAVDAVESEEQLEELLRWIIGASAADLEALETELANLLDRYADLAPEGAADELPGAVRAQGIEAVAVIDSWASLISFAVIQFYSRTEPGDVGAAFRRRSAALIGWLPGVARGVAAQLRYTALVWRRPLEKAARLAGATAFSIEFGIPQGLAIGLEWGIGDVVAVLVRDRRGRVYPA